MTGLLKRLRFPLLVCGNILLGMVAVMAQGIPCDTCNPLWGFCEDMEDDCAFQCWSTWNDIMTYCNNTYYPQGGGEWNDCFIVAEQYYNSCMNQCNNDFQTCLVAIGWWDCMGSCGYGGGS